MSAGAHRTAGPGGISSASAPALDLPARFMALAMIGFAVVAALLPWAAPLLLRGFYNPYLLAFVHLNTLGIVAALIVGASYQLVPVVLQTPLASPRLGRLSFWLHLSGLILFVPGLVRTWLPGLAAGSSLLLAGFTAHLIVIGWTVRRAPSRDVVAWHIAGALVSLAGGVVLGVLLAFNKVLGFLGPLTYRLLAAHVTLLVAGWVAVLLCGVAYRLVGMFTLSEDRLWRPVAWLELACSVLGAWLVAASFLIRGGEAIRLSGGVLVASGQTLFATQLVHLYRGRRRPGVDVHMPFALAAAGFGLAAGLLLAAGLALDAPGWSRLWVAAGWLAIGGLAETAIQGFFYKIATFLVWLNRYAPQAGRRRMPRLEDLYLHRLALAGCALWTTGILVSAFGLAADSGPSMRLAGAIASAGLVCFLVNVVRIGGHWRPIRIGRYSWGAPACVPSAGKD